MALAGRKTKVQQTWESSFAGFGDLSSSAGTILSNLSDTTSPYPHPDAHPISTTAMIADDLAGSDTSYKENIPSARCVTPPNELSHDEFSVPETPRGLRTTNVVAVHRCSCNESLDEITAENDGEQTELNADAQQSLDTFLDHILDQYGTNNEGTSSARQTKRKPVKAKPSVPRKRTKLTQASHLSKAAVILPRSPGIDAFLKGILSATKHNVDIEELSAQPTPDRSSPDPDSHNDVESQKYVPLVAVDDAKEIDKPITLSEQPDNEISKDEKSLEFSIADSSAVSHCNSDPVAVGECTLTDALSGRSSNSEARDSQHLVKEKITHIMPTESLAELGGTVHSQFIESGCSTPAADQSILFNCLSQPSAPSQIIASLDSTLHSKVTQTDGNMVWTPLSIISANQTPDIHDKVEEVVNSSRAEKLPSTGDRVKKFVKGGLAEMMDKIIKRDKSNYAVCRHAVTLNTPSPTCLLTSKHASFTAIVIDTSSQVVIRCKVMEGNLELRGECYVVTNSIKQECRVVRAGDRITVYHPWRVTNHPDLGTVIFATSYCDVTELNIQSDDSSCEKATPTSVLIGHRPSPCTDHKKQERHPKYKGPYAFLYQ